MNKFDINKIHSIHAEMLKELTDFCDKNNIKYFLEAGTLLGAIRHKGFIPWDDDIDISMLRSEYNKFIELLKKNPNISDNLYASSPEINNSSFPFCKIYNRKYGVMEKDTNLDEREYLWIDIFPYDGISDNKCENKKLYKKIKKYRRYLAIRLQKMDGYLKKEKNILKKLIKFLYKLIINIKSACYYSKKISKIACRFDYNKCSLFQNIIWTDTNYDVYYSKDFFDNLIEVEFEGYKFKTICKYDEHLKKIYGDYMKLPPKDKRVTHLIDFWEIENEEKN